ncbi:DUF6262 family protein [Actinoplanes sp. NBRC 101535]|uniref:DUF6262 family protein n=1 Tax=Actinoplanes sp. NBRC 101535 TaxID=3032196 RepID=UPI003337AFB2
MRAAAQRKHDEATARAKRALIAIRARGGPINFTSIAAEANVSKDFLYTQPELRQAITAERTAVQGTVPLPAAERSTASSATVNLAVATKALAQLRAENTQLRADNARLLGELMTLRRTTSLNRLG